MSTRRTCIKGFFAGTAALALTESFPAAGAFNRILGANDRVRIGLIGAGGRGQAILKAALRCPNVEAVGVADLYTRRLEEVKQFVPNARVYSDFRKMLEDKSIDALLIATPQHQHALNFVPSIEAGKDVYQEKTMAFNPDHAKRMRKAMEGSGRIVQVGIQSISGPSFEKVRELATPEKMGTITALHTHQYRNAPYGGWMRPVPPDCDLQHVGWRSFEGEAHPHEFTADRFINWRFYWDYSGGNVFENMVHQVGFWYKAMDLKIPLSVSMSGGNYLSPKMQVPDTMDVSMEQPEKLLFTWNSMFGNRYFGDGHDLLLGNKGTIVRNEAEEVSYLPQDAKGAGPVSPGEKLSSSTPDVVGGSDETDIHMQNFFDCVRSRKEPACPFAIGFRAAIACQMAIASFRQGKTVRWDPQREEIV